MTSKAQPELRPEEYRKLAALLHAWTGIRLQAKEHLMLSRLAPRIRELGLGRYRDYLELLQEHGRDSHEGQAFINALTTNKTSFFREAHHFTFLVERLFPELKERALDGGPRRLRLYSAGCSRGAEPYTMALLAATHLPVEQGWDVRILATDLDTDVLKEAAEGVYPAEELEDVPVALRKRWFVREAHGMRLRPEAAGLVTFKRANLIAQPFPVKGKFDAVFCRNVMIYFDRPTQEQLVVDLCRLTAPQGYLVIGHSEGLLGQHMERVHNVVGVYRPHGKVTPRRSLAARSHSTAPKARSLAPEARSLAPKARSLAPKSRSLVPKTRSLAPKTRSLAPKSKSRSLVPKARSLAPKSRSLAPKSKSRTLASLAPKAHSQAPKARSLAPKAGSHAAKDHPAKPKLYKPVTRTPHADARRSHAARATSHPPVRRPKAPFPELPQKRIVLGEWFSAKGATLISTLLGSCVAACLYDPVAQIGGMNHFMLPSSDADAGSGARFGIHAMEILINELMRKGADRKRLLAKAFGAAAVNRTLTSTVAAQNGTFIREFLARENIPLVAERLGGIEAREIFMRTDNGEAHVRRIAANQADRLAETELQAWKRLSLRPPPAQPFNPDDALL